MTVSFVASFIGADDIASNKGTAASNTSTYTSVASGQFAIFCTATRTETQTYNTPTNGSWTALTNLNGGDSAHGANNTTNDNGLSRVGAWYQVLVGTESGSVGVSTTGANDNCQVSTIISYSTDQASFASPIYVTGSDDGAHGASRSVTFGTWGSSLQVGDVIVVINSVDTDNAAIISASSFTQSGTTFSTSTRRARGLNGSGSDNGIYVYEATVTAGGSTSALTFDWTGGPNSCGPAIAIRIRDVAANPPQTVNLSLVTETSTGQTLTGAKRAATALISGTQTAQAVNEQKTKALVLTTATNTAQAITYSRQQSVNQVSITNTAQPIIATFTGKVNLVTETDSAFTHGKRKNKTLNLVIQDNFILGLAGQHQQTLALTSDESIAQALNEQKFNDVEVILEDSIAQPITRQRAYNLSQVSEIDRAITLGTRYQLLQVIETDSVPVTSRFKRRSLALITETDAEFAIQPFHTDAVAQVMETDTSQPLHIIYTRLVHQVSETDVAFAIHQFLKRDLSMVSETDSVGDLIDFIKQKQLVLVVGSDIARAIGPKIQHPPSSIILDVTIPDPTQLTVFIEDDEVTSGLVVLVSQRL